MDPLDDIPDDVLLHGAAAELALHVARPAVQHTVPSGVLLAALGPLIRSRYSNDPASAYDASARAAAAVEGAPPHLKEQTARRELRLLFGDDLPDWFPNPEGD